MSSDDAAAAAPQTEPTPTPSDDATKTSQTGSPAGGAHNPKSQYYYWHGHEKDRAAVGDVAPKVAPPLLKTEAVVTTGPTIMKTLVKDYTWCNNDKTVSVWIDFPNVAPEHVAVTFGVRRLTVTIRPPSGAAGGSPVIKEHVLDTWLLKDIDPSSSYRVKPGQIVIKLVKAKQEHWYELAGKADPAPEDE